MNPPRMTYAERTARTQAKQLALLRFLASGEVYTVSDVAASLLACSPRRALATLQQLEAAESLKSEEHMVNSRKCKIFGLTPHGAALAGVFDAPVFELGRTNSSWINHRLDGQRMHIKADSAGWQNWQTERSLQNRGLKKVPDALAVNPAGHRVAIEIERTVKSKKRFADIVAAYLSAMRKNELDVVYYLSPPGLEKVVEKAFQNIKSVNHNSEKVLITENHRSRFKFLNFDEFAERKK